MTDINAWYCNFFEGRKTPHDWFHIIMDQKFIEGGFYMGERKRKTSQNNAPEGLSQKMMHSFSKINRRVLLIVAVEAILISSILVILYISKTNRSTLQDYTAQIDKSMNSKVSMLETAAAGINSGTIEGKEAVQEYVDSIQALDKQVSAVYSCYDENITIMSGGWTPPDDFVVTEREWYIKAQENPDQVYISDPYVDEQSGGICITLSKATYKNGKVAGVIGLDMYMDDLVSLLELSYSGNSYVFLTTSTGTILVHPNEAFRLKDEKGVSVSEANKGRYASLIKKGTQSKILLDYKGGFKFAASMDSNVTGWKIVSVNPLSTLLIFIVILLVIYSLLYIATQIIANKTTSQKVSEYFRPLESICNKISFIAEGDLSVVFDEEKNSTEIEHLTNSLNETISSLRYYMDSISNTVNAISNKDLTITIDGDFKGHYVQIKDALETILVNLNETFVQIQEQAKNVLQYSGELANSTENVAQNATNQNVSVSEVATAVDKLNIQTKQITDRALSIKENAEVTNQHLQNGTDEMKNLTEAMVYIEECSEKISDFVVEINNIAEETNLLALNASIEAARAGESGKGFAVVANEISSLASSSAEASANITTLIEESKNAVCKGKNLVSVTSDTMIKSAEDAVTSEENIKQIVDFVKEQQEAIESIHTSLGTISEMVESNAASAQESTAISQQLADCAKTLNTTTEEFSLH